MAIHLKYPKRHNHHAQAALEHWLESPTSVAIVLDDLLQVIATLEWVQDTLRDAGAISDKVDAERLTGVLDLLKCLAVYRDFNETWEAHARWAERRAAETQTD